MIRKTWTKKWVKVFDGNFEVSFIFGFIWPGWAQFQLPGKGSIARKGEPATSQPTFACQCAGPPLGVVKQRPVREVCEDRARENVMWELQELTDTDALTHTT